MKLHAIVSSVALAAALSFSGGAFAQNMLNGVEIPSDQIQSFKGKCEALLAASTSSLATPNAEDTEADPTETGSIDPQTSNADSDPAARDNWAQALAALTAEECEAAGFAS
jgi:hypothetical protein